MGEGIVCVRESFVPWGAWGSSSVQSRDRVSISGSSSVIIASFVSLVWSAESWIPSGSPPTARPHIFDGSYGGGISEKGRIRLCFVSEDSDDVPNQESCF